MYDIGLPALYMCITVPLGFLLNGEWHYGSEEMLVGISATNICMRNQVAIIMHECELNP